VVVGSRKSGKRFVLATLGVAAAMVFAGCDWPMFGFDAAHSGSSSDKAINTANVSALQPLFTSSGQFGPPVASNGVAYATNTNGNLEAFDGNGTTIIPIDMATNATEPPISVSDPIGIAIH
jgi:hypothetical protein